MFHIMNVANNHSWTMIQLLLKITLFAFFLPKASCQIGPVDVALNKIVTAEVTCGANGPETYFGHSQIFLRPSSRIIETCENASSHPASAMVDGDLNTWWQSTDRGQLINAGYGLNEKPQAIIVIDLEQYFEVEKIIIRMGDSRRPGRITLYKSVDGVDYDPWIYRVTYEEMCNTLYKIPQASTPRSPESPICTAYRSRFPATQYEPIQFDLSKVDPAFAAWRNLRYIKMEFREMDLTLGINGIKFQHYTVTDLKVFAECVCNGQAETCAVNNQTGKFQCVCGGNTTGSFCEMCDPFYNQFAFMYGRPCEECNCFDHASSCFYDAITENFSRSMDANGVYRGGGVCIDCRDNAAGVNCEKCKPYYYRKVGVDQRSANVCISCDCHGPGVVVNPQTGLTGDCIMNDDNMLPLGMVPGDCICKSNVTGSKCDKCKVGFYDLMEENPYGCTDCGCETRGTVGATPVCNFTTGQCPCKNNVMGKHCADCANEFYDMTTEDMEGCKPCLCDIGAAESNVCDKESGQCPCRKNIDTRECKKPDNSSYFPDAHFLHGEFESIRSSWARILQGYTGFGYATLSESVPGITHIPIPTDTLWSGNFYLLFRYETHGNITGEAYVFAPGVATITAQLNFPACQGVWCYYRYGEATDKKLYLLDGKTYTIRVSVQGKLNLDRVIILPVEFTNATVPLDKNTEQFNSLCDVYTNDMRIGTLDETFCLQNLFSMTTYYLNGALQCDCHFLGSVPNTTCEQYGGQCQCQPGTGGRKCDDCLLEYYDMQEGGCRPCGCGSDYKVCDSITGHCVCPPNIVGRKCDQCMVNHWNWTAAYGCEPCECSPIGAASLQCNLTTGECRCKTGVLGPKCHECQDGYKSFSWTGCVPCGCDPAGSLSDICNQRTDQCPCKLNVQGRLCDLCKMGTFNLQGDHHEGCLDCVCMGITQQCTSSPWRLKSVEVPLISSSDVNRTTNFDIVTERDTMIMDLVIVEEDGVKMAQATIGSQPRQYWAPVEGISGNLVSLMQNKIFFTVMYTATDPSGLPLENNKLIIISNYRSKRYYLHAPSVNYGVMTEINITVSHENLMSENVTRGEFMMALQDVAMILIPASYYDRMHTSRIGNLRYEIAAPDGTGERALASEKCSCPAGYDGQSCERCARGYMREGVGLHEFLGTCKPCVCHNHATECDPDTGECIDCKHHTEGKTCNECRTGYYGNPEVGTPYDCFACPCLEPRVMNGTCLVGRVGIECLYCAEGYSGDLCDECDEFFYGNPEVPLLGKCEPCFCNGNTGQCNKKTGECINCLNNSTGFHCERCSDGYYGNATSQACNACACSLVGSRSAICNYEDGQCQCFSGVGGRTCDACLPDFYGFTNSSFQGCTECNCNQFGSESTQCDEFGKCTCAVNVEGGKCSLCSAGYWGLPTQTCEVCGCDPVGTVDPAAPCESVTGQCVCKPGVGGRTCDSCQFLHINFGDTGCQTCTECQYSMGNDTRALAEQLNEYLTEMEMIGEVQQLDAEMQYLALLINKTSVTLGLSEGRLDVLTNGVQQLKSAAPGYNKTVEDLVARLAALEMMSYHVDNASIDELSRQEAFQTTIDQTYQDAIELNSSAPAIIERVRFYKVTADKLYADSGQTSSGMDVNFDVEEATIKEVAANISKTAARADIMLANAESTGNITSYLANITVTVKSQLTQIDTKIKETSSVMINVKAKANAVWTDFNTTVYYKAHAVALFSEAQTLILMAQAILDQSIANSQLASKLIEDTEGILNGVSSGPLPVDPNIIKPEDITGIYSWNQASQSLDIQINSTEELVKSKYGLVEDMESRAQNLTRHVQALISEFDRVRPHGDKAVEVIKNYEEVAQTLMRSVDMALDANRTISLVMDSLIRVSVVALEEESQNSLAESQALHEELIKAQANSEVLHQRLKSANTSLTSALTQWDNRYELSKVFLQAATAIHKLAKDTNSGLEEDSDQYEPLVAEPIESAYVAADVAIQTADIVISQDEGFQSDIEAQVAMADYIREENHNATDLATSLKNRLDNYQHVVTNDIQTNLDLAGALRNETADMRTTIEAQISSIEEKIERARLRLLGMEQPVGLKKDEHEEVRNPVAGQSPMLHNELTIDFQVPKAKRVYTKRSGVLLFMENNQTEEFFSLHFVDGLLVFEFNNHEEPLRITSKADICAGCWFRVIATRYGIDGHLTVIRMSDGALATDHVRGYTLQDRLSINTPIYIGGLPANYDTTKVTTADGEFEGCVYNAHLDGEKLGLWENMVNQQSAAQCCIKPRQPPRPATLTGCFCFSGFDSSHVSSSNYSISPRSFIQFEFRTFDRSGVLMLIDKPFSTSFYGLFLREGEVIFSYGGPGGNVELKTARSYSDGQWYQLTAMHNQTYTMLVVEYVDKSISAVVEVKSFISRGQDLSALEDATMTFGGQNPQTESHGPAISFFAGCIKELSFMRSDDFTVHAVDILEDTTEENGVSSKYCYEKVTQGIGFTNVDSYARLANVRMTISVVEFSFQTHEPSGILVYGQRPEGIAPYFYIALFNGDIFVMFNQGIGIQPVLRTRGLYLSDGREHAVYVDFSYQNNPRLTVNGGVHHGAVKMTPNIAISGGHIFIGGVPQTVALPTELPVHTSLIGGLRNLQINGQLIDLYSPNQFDSRVQKFSWLSGLPLPPVEPPLLPYSTTPAPPTTPHPTCAAPYEISYSNKGLRFGHESASFAGFDTSGNPSLFKNSFTITVEFRAVQPNGIIAYAANSADANPTYYFSLFLENGYIFFNMDSNSAISNANPSRTKRVKTKYQYNTGKWVEVTVLRINDFIALVVTATRDYKNNGVSSTSPSNLEINTMLYIGGVPETYVGLPFGGEHDIPMGNQAFHGCIRKVEVATHNPEPVSFDLANPTVKQGTLPCFDSVQPGIFLNSSDASIRLSSSDKPTVYNIVPNIKFNLTFHGSARDGTLIVAYQSLTRFFLLELFEGEIKGILSAAGEGAIPFEFSSGRFLGPYSLCDGSPHTVLITLTVSEAQMKVDNLNIESFRYPAGFIFTPIYGTPVYIGSHAESSLVFPVVTSGRSYRGCIGDFHLNDQTYVLAEMQETSGTFSGCPGLPDAT